MKSVKQTSKFCATFDGMSMLRCIENKLSQRFAVVSIVEQVIAPRLSSAIVTALALNLLFCTVRDEAARNIKLFSG